MRQRHYSDTVGNFKFFWTFCNLVLILVLIISFTKMQPLVKRTGLTNPIYFKGALSMRKGASERFCPQPQSTLASYATERNLISCYNPVCTSKLAKNSTLMYTQSLANYTKWNLQVGPRCNWPGNFGKICAIAGSEIGERVKTASLYPENQQLQWKAWKWKESLIDRNV